MSCLKISFECSFSLRWFQWLSCINLATRRCSKKEQPVHQRFTFPGPLVLRSRPLNFHASTVDRDQTVSRRSKPSSRTTLIGEQPNPWNLLQLQDVMSRHRGAKRLRRYELLGIISLLSPAYLLFVERWFFHAKSPDHYDQLSFLFELSLLQSSRLVPLRLHVDCWPTQTYLCTPPLLFRRRPPQSNYPLNTVLRWEVLKIKSGISLWSPQFACAKGSSTPTYATHDREFFNV